jgi:hypothetical protein
MNRAYLTTRMDWEGVALLVRWRPGYFAVELDEGSRVEIGHLVIEAETGERLPISETGYRSHFIAPDALIPFDGDPAAYARAWLDHKAASDAWQAHIAARAQLSLF